ncbi:MAG: RNA polymerase sigma factor [Thiohalomonadaceae bacterium]
MEEIMGILGLFCRSHDFNNRLEQNRKRLYRVAYSWCHNTHLADDLVQETMLQAMKSAASLRSFEAMDSWLFSILTNCWRGHLRSRRDLQEFDENDFQSDSSPEATNQQMQTVHRVRNAVAQLPQGQREVVTLVDLEGFSYAEVAEILTIPIGTVMSRLCRARQALKEKLIDAAADGRQQEPRLVRIK